MSQPGLFDFPGGEDPPAARASDPGTTWEGWDKVQATLGQRQALVAEAFEKAPEGLTGHELATRLQHPHNCLSTRITELCRKGILLDSGERRMGPAGVRQIVWKHARFR